ncbi:MAG: NADH-quinone oxidoreductase subunit J [Cyclobacteriaceae bacterium]|nr:NADH-quinone oxidoreductase subunit J [Cyclobacteriaceae bacterium]MDH4296643.1 NADH-quinone oxidoreductase subunit J [Cyclobacteriaceae bacterium]MDH5249556.1 NADH-quinone oxidoreductase subunit J [Cyclobacteriaceae bacterium]
MNIASFMFYFFEFAAASSAFALIFIRNVFYGALLLIICLLALAGIYVLAFAEFIAVAQILVYAGGILVVIIFGIMLTTKISGKPLVVEHMYELSGTLAGLSLLALLIYVISRETSFAERAVYQQQYDSVNRIGIDLMSEFVMPFEIGGILLLIALIGAAVTASTIKSK